jgi:hypothetical protein
MPLTEKGEKIRAAMHAQYGAKKGESVFYASINKGKITGAEKGGKVRSGQRHRNSPPLTHTATSSHGNESFYRGVAARQGNHDFTGKAPHAGHPIAHAKGAGGGRW